MTFNTSKTVPKIVKILANVFRHWATLDRDPNDVVREWLLSLVEKEGICKSMIKHFTICWPSSFKQGTAFSTANALENATT